MFRTAFQILRNNILFIQPVLLYLLFVMTLASHTYLNSANLTSRIAVFTSIFMLTVALISGWLHINKLALKDYNPKDEAEVVANKTVNNFKQFFAGVGENFVKIFFALLVLLLFFVLVFYGLNNLCLELWGIPKIFTEMTEITKIQTQAEMMNYLNTISDVDKLAFINWIWTFVISTSIMNFFAILYLTVIYLDKKNIFISFWNAIKFFLKNILGSFSIIGVSFLFYILLNILSLIIGANTIAFVILIMMYVFYLNYYILLVFCFYNEKTKDISNNRPE